MPHSPRAIQNLRPFPAVLGFLQFVQQINASAGTKTIQLLEIRERTERDADKGSVHGIFKVSRGAAAAAVKEN